MSEDLKIVIEAATGGVIKAVSELKTVLQDFTSSFARMAGAQASTSKETTDKIVADLERIKKAREELLKENAKKTARLDEAAGMGMNEVDYDAEMAANKKDLAEKLAGLQKEEDAIKRVAGTKVKTAAEERLVMEQQRIDNDLLAAKKFATSQEDMVLQRKLVALKKESAFATARAEWEAEKERIGPEDRSEEALKAGVAAKARYKQQLRQIIVAANQEEAAINQKALDDQYNKQMRAYETQMLAAKNTGNKELEIVTSSNVAKLTAQKEYNDKLLQITLQGGKESSQEAARARASIALQKQLTAIETAESVKRIQNKAKEDTAKINEEQKYAKHLKNVGEVARLEGEKQLITLKAQRDVFTAKAKGSGLSDIEANIVGLEKFKDKYGEAYDEIIKKTKDATAANVAFAEASKNEGALQALNQVALRAGAASVAIMTAFSTAIKPAMELEKALSAVAAVSQMKMGDLGMTDLRDTAIDLGQQFLYTSGEIAGGMKMLAQAGFEVPEIQKMSKDILDLATAADMPLSNAFNIAATTIRAFTMDASQMRRVTDVLVTTANRTNVEVQDLAESFKYAGPVAAAAGVKFEDVAASLGIMANAGIKGSMGGTALRQTISSLIAPTSNQRRMIEELGLSLTDLDGKITGTKGNFVGFQNVVGQLETIFKYRITDPADQAGLAMKLFGDRAGPGMLAVINEGVAGLVKLNLEFKRAAENAGGAGSASDTAAARMNNLTDSLTKFGLATQALNTTILFPMLNSIKEIVQWFTKAMNTMADFVQSHPGLAKVAGALIGITVAAGALLGGFSAIALAVSAIGTVMAHNAKQSVTWASMWRASLATVSGGVQTLKVSVVGLGVVNAATGGFFVQAMTRARQATVQLRVDLALARLAGASMFTTLGLQVKIFTAGLWAAVKAAGTLRGIFSIGLGALSWVSLLLVFLPMIVEYGSKLLRWMGVMGAPEVTEKWKKSLKEIGDGYEAINEVIATVIKGNDKLAKFEPPKPIKIGETKDQAGNKVDIMGYSPEQWKTITAKGKESLSDLEDVNKRIRELNAKNLNDAAYSKQYIALTKELGPIKQVTEGYKLLLDQKRKTLTETLLNESKFLQQGGSKALGINERNARNEAAKKAVKESEAALISLRGEMNLYDQVIMEAGKTINTRFIPEMEKIGLIAEETSSKYKDQIETMNNLVASQERMAFESELNLSSEEKAIASRNRSMEAMKPIMDREIADWKALADRATKTFNEDAEHIKAQRELLSKSSALGLAEDKKLKESREGIANLGQNQAKDEEAERTKTLASLKNFYSQAMTHAKAYWADAKAKGEVAAQAIKKLNAEFLADKSKMYEEAVSIQDAYLTKTRAQLEEEHLARKKLINDEIEDAKRRSSTPDLEKGLDKSASYSLNRQRSALSSAKKMWDEADQATRNRVANSGMLGQKFNAEQRANEEARRNEARKTTAELIIEQLKIANEAEEDHQRTLAQIEEVKQAKLKYYKEVAEKANIDATAAEAEITSLDDKLKALGVTLETMDQTQIRMNVEHNMEKTSKEIDDYMARIQAEIDKEKIITIKFKVDGSEIEKEMSSGGWLTKLINAFTNTGGEVAGPRNEPVKKAEGGLIPGFGGGDVIPAMLEPGEFVIRKNSVRSFGTSFFEALNNMSTPSMPMALRRMTGTPRIAMATGGLVPGMGKAEKTVNVNLNLGGKQYPLVGRSSVVAMLTEQMRREGLTS